MGNDVACKTQGIGSIRLKLHNGSIRVLTDVRYVSDLKKNLLSLGTLDSKGFRISIQDGVLKVVLGSYGYEGAKARQPILPAREYC